MIAAIILAAGQSKRMGQPKMSLPWGETTVLGHVIATHKAAGVEDIVVVTGSFREEVERLVGDLARTVFNPAHARGEMLSSVQAGLRSTSAEAALIVLGDQPQVPERSVRQIIRAHIETGASILVPSYRLQRGHPWLVTKTHRTEILQMESPATLRDFLNRHANHIHYVELDDSSILQDLDTPKDYLKYKP